MSASLPPLPKPQESTGEPVLLELGSAEDEPCLRADAARNRARLLEAATRLIEEHGAVSVTMEAVAVAASVGKGTVFRRFGDRTGLLTALLDHSAKQLQAAFLSGRRRWAPGRRPSTGCGRSAWPSCVRRPTTWSSSWRPSRKRPAATPSRLRVFCPVTSPCCCGRRCPMPTAHSSPRP